MKSSNHPNYPYLFPNQIISNQQDKTQEESILIFMKEIHPIKVMYFLLYLQNEWP